MTCQATLQCTIINDIPMYLGRSVRTMSTQKVLRRLPVARECLRVLSRIDRSRRKKRTGLEQMHSSNAGFQHEEPSRPWAF